MESDSQEREVTTEAQRRRPGFTLIELVVVMGIMLLLSMVVVGSYVGMTRAIAARAGINQLRNAVLITRQHACMDGKRTYLYVLDGTNYVLCRRVGVVSKGAPGSFQDFYSDLQSLAATVPRTVAEKDRLRLYNLDRTPTSGNPYVFLGSDATTTPVTRNRLDGGWLVYFTPTTKFFNDGEAYGIEVYPMRVLPRGFLFSQASQGKSMYFDPSGKPGGLSKIEIYEAIKPGLLQSVSIINGKISVDTRGTEQ